jgi:hypothetical protein
MSGWRLLVMRSIENCKEKMAKGYIQIIVIFLAVVLVAACTSTPTPTSSPTTIPPTPVAVVSESTDPAPTIALSATATIPSPTTAPSTEKVENDTDQDNFHAMETNRMNIKIGDIVLTVTLVENSSVDALKEALSEGPITLNMRDYGSMEKVGSLGMDLPRNDEQITTEAGDIILYQGNAFVIYYAPNSWNFTRLGKIDNATAEELREILGGSNVTVTLSLPQE